MLRSVIRTFFIYRYIGQFPLTVQVGNGYPDQSEDRLI